MAKRNRNQKRKKRISATAEEKSSVPKIESEIPTKEESVKQVEEETKIEKKERVQESQKEEVLSLKTQKETPGLLEKLFNIIFIFIFTLPVGYYFLKLSPENELKIDKIVKNRELEQESHRQQLLELSKAKTEVEKKVSLELEKEKALENKLHLAEAKSKSLQEKIENESKSKEAVEAKLRLALAKVKELTLKIDSELEEKKRVKNESDLALLKLKEIETQNLIQKKSNLVMEDKLKTIIKERDELKAKLIFVVTKGKELEETCKALKAKENKE